MRDGHITKACRHSSVQSWLAWTTLLFSTTGSWIKCGKHVGAAPARKQWRLRDLAPAPPKLEECVSLECHINPRESFTFRKKLLSVLCQSLSCGSTNTLG